MKSLEKKIEKIIYKELKSAIGGVIALDTSAKLSKKVIKYLNK